METVNHSTVVEFSTNLKVLVVCSSASDYTASPLNHSSVVNGKDGEVDVLCMQQTNETYNN